MGSALKQRGAVLSGPPHPRTHPQQEHLGVCHGRSISHQDGRECVTARPWGPEALSCSTAETAKDAPRPSMHPSLRCTLANSRAVCTSSTHTHTHTRTHTHTHTHTESKEPRRPSRHPSLTSSPCILSFPPFSSSPPLIPARWLGGNQDRRGRYEARRLWDDLWP